MARTDDVDLPEPPERSALAGEAAAARRLRLALALLLFAALYSSIHKLWLPLFLRTTSLRATSYAHVEFAFLLGLALWYWLRRGGRLGAVGSTVAGALVGLAALEAWAVFDGRYLGWLALSHALSSWPLGAVALALFALPSIEGRLLWAWIGAAAASVAWFGQATYQDRVASSPVAAVSSRLEGAPGPSPPARTCGARSVELTVAEEVASSDRLEIRECGFFPSVMAWPESGRVRVFNASPRAANVHLRVGGLGWNLLVPAGAEVLSPASPGLASEEAAFVYSDARPDAGLSVLARPNRTSDWRFSRQPPRSERIR
jgi:hypothetical protein